MKLLQLLKEAKQVGILYHFTSPESALEILSSNQLKSEGNSISFTRNKKYLYEPGSHGKKLQLVRIAIDGDRLSENYKISPFQNPYNKAGDEAEERIVNIRRVADIKKYIIDITVDNANILNLFAYNHLVKLLQDRKNDRATISEKAKKLGALDFEKFYASIKKYGIPVKEEALTNI